MNSKDPAWTLQLDVAQLCAFIAEVYPPAAELMELEALEAGALSLRYRVEANDLRPGGTVSGPVMFSAVDLAFYALTLSLIGPEALAVTSSVTINFLRKPPLGDLRCAARMLKLGRGGAVMEAHLESAVDGRLVAQASGRYAIPR